MNERSGNVVENKGSSSLATEGKKQLRRFFVRQITAFSE